MRKLVGCAMLVAFCCAPAMAVNTWTPVDLTGIDFAVGVIDPATGQLGVPVLEGERSDVFTLQFGLYVSPAMYSYFAESLTFSFAYDNTVMKVDGMRAMGSAWVTTNYEGAAFPNSSHGTQAIDGLFQAVAAGDYEPFYDGDVTPIFEVDLHVKSATYSQIGEFGIILDGFGVEQGYGLTLVSTISPDYNLYPSAFAYFGGKIHEIPEPSTMLLIGGVAAGLVGFARRRR